MPIHSCELVSNEQVARDVYHLEFHSEPISRAAHPGQFVHIRTSPESDPLLRRPFSIHDVDQQSARVEILFQLVGAGTRILASKRRGEMVDVFGPLGRGFRSGSDLRRSIVAAGGIGIAPFPFLVRRLIKGGNPVLVLAGWKTADEVVATEKITSLGASVEVATEDGSQGYVGTVAELLESRLKSENQGSEGLILYACGPKAMLGKVAQLARRHSIPCQVSLEERMACGVGACLGCAVRGAGRDSASSEYRLVCRDGPVFDVNEVNLE